MDGGGLLPVRTTCACCGVGCGVLATPDGRGGLTVAGDPAHPANAGRLCSKGAALGETVSTEGRRLHPRVHGARAGWNDALDLVAARFRETIAAHGPDAVAFHVSGQMLTEDYYVANKLMKGFIGPANIDTNSRLCMASTVAGHLRAFGSDTVPGIHDDLDEADTIVLAVSNLARCHPILMGRIATAEQADLHLAIANGADVALFSSLPSPMQARSMRAFCAIMWRALRPRWPPPAVTIRAPPGFPAPTSTPSPRPGSATTGW